MSGPCEWIIDKLCGGLSVMEQHFPVSSDKGEDEAAGRAKTNKEPKLLQSQGSKWPLVLSLSMSGNHE